MSANDIWYGHLLVRQSLNVFSFQDGMFQHKIWGRGYTRNWNGKTLDFNIWKCSCWMPMPEWRFSGLFQLSFEQDCKNLGGRNICVMTDRTLVKLPPVQVVCDALEKAGLKYSVYDKCRVEPSDERWIKQGFQNPCFKNI